MQATLARSWLALQCQMVPGTSRGIVAVLGSGAEALEPLAGWPDASPASAGLMAVARLAVERAAPVLAPARASAQDGGAKRLGIALPIERAGTVVGAVALEVVAAEAQQQAIIGLMRWGQAFLDLAHGAQAGESTDGDGSADIIARLLEQPDAQGAATALAGELAHRLGCERASVGLCRRGGVRIVALSDTSRVDARTNLARRIEAVMDEALEHDAPVVHPAPSAAATSDALARLAEAEGSAHVLGASLQTDAGLVGALVLERGAPGPFDASSVALVERAAELAAPVLELKLAVERTALARLGASVSGPGHFARRIALGAALGCAALVTFVEGEYRVSAPATLEGTVHRAVVVPYDGFVVSAQARAGDTVASGDVLAELDDRDLRIALRRLEREREELSKERGKSFAAQDYAEARILESRIGQAQARMDLTEEQLSRTRLTAPFTGVVVSGDLSRSLGSPVARGDVLFEIAPLDAYRVALEVEDRDIADVGVGQQGLITLSALPGERLAFEVSNVATVSRGEDGAPIYRVEANLVGSPEGVRPGMGGIAKINAGKRRLIDAWTRPITNRLRLWLWRWLP